MSFCVYVLKSEVDGRLYKGMTSNFENRIREHNKGKVSATKGYRPWKLVHLEKFETLQEARAREVYLKNGIGSGVSEENEFVNSGFPACRQAGNPCRLTT